MQWDIPFINNIDIYLLKYLAGSLNTDLVLLIESIYQFKPIKFLPFVMFFCWLWYKTDKTEVKKKLIDTVTYGFVSLVLCRILSYTAPFRPRPKNIPLFDDKVTNILTDGWSSFPSDHGVFSFAMSYGLFRINPLYGVCFGVYSLLVICLPRAILHIHYPSDLIAGALLGLCFAYILSKLDSLKKLSDYLYNLSVAKPAIFYSLSAIILFEFVEMFGTPLKIIFVLHDILKV